MSQFCKILLCPRIECRFETLPSHDVLERGFFPASCAGLEQQVSWDHQRFSLLPRELTSLQIMKCSCRSKPAAREERLIVLSTAFVASVSRRFVQSFQGCHHTEVLVCFTGSLSNRTNSYAKAVNRTPVLISKEPPALLHIFCFLSFI